MDVLVSGAPNKVGFVINMFIKRRDRPIEFGCNDPPFYKIAFGSLYYTSYSLLYYIIIIIIIRLAGSTRQKMFAESFSGGSLHHQPPRKILRRSC